MRVHFERKPRISVFIFYHVLRSVGLSLTWQAYKTLLTTVNYI